MGYIVGSMYAIDTGPRSASDKKQSNLLANRCLNDGCRATGRVDAVHHVRTGIMTRRVSERSL